MPRSARFVGTTESGILRTDVSKARLGAPGGEDKRRFPCGMTNKKDKKIVTRVLDMTRTLDVKFACH
jgi:hypothetical protein